MLIGFTGYAGSGKDTAAQFLVDRGWTRIGFADAVRDMAYAINPIVGGCRSKRIRLQDVVDEDGWDSAKRDFGEIRELLQRIGTEGGRSIFGEDCWIEIAKRKVDFTDGPVVITDCRFPNEAELIRELGILVKVERPGFGPANNHASEQAIEADLIDYILHNDGEVYDLHEGLSTILEAEWPHWQPS